MKFPIGAMSVGDILDRGLKLLLSRFGTFYSINLIVLFPMLLFQLAQPSVMAALAEAGEGGGQGPDPTLAISVLVGFLVFLFLAFLLSFVGNAATLRVVLQEFTGRSTGVGDALGFAFGRVGKLLWTSFLAGLVITLGYLACIIPGIIFLVWFIFVGQVVVVEDLSGAPALGRSRSLTEGFRWRVVGVALLLGIVYILFGLAVGGLETALPSRELVPTERGLAQVPIYPNFYINLVVTFLVQIVVQTYSAICWTLFYFDIRIRKEGFDLELASQKQADELGWE